MKHEVLLFTIFTALEHQVKQQSSFKQSCTIVLHDKNTLLIILDIVMSISIYFRSLLLPPRPATHSYVHPPYSLLSPRPLLFGRAATTDN